MRYLLGLLGIVGLIIVVTVLIVRGFGGDESKAGPSLTSYAETSTVMRYTVEAPINADQVHQSLRITVGRNQAKAEVLQGYHDVVIDTISYPNNQEAYGVFLRALDLMAFQSGNDDPNLQDERGFCADGNLSVFEITEGEHQIQRYWSTSCGDGNFGGDVPKIIGLFEAQIPDLGTFTEKLSL